MGLNGELKSNGVKLFETKEEMQNDPSAEEKDLAVVYRTEMQKCTVDSIFNTAMFPETVILSKAVTEYIGVSFRPIESDTWYDCYVTLNQQMFRLETYSETSETYVAYTSSDGITYTRARIEGDGVNGDIIEFGIDITCYYKDEWDDRIGDFVNVGGMVFDGLYRFGKYVDSDLIYLPDTTDFTIQDNTLVLNDSAIDINKCISRSQYEDWVNTTFKNVFVNPSFFRYNNQICALAANTGTQIYGWWIDNKIELATDTTNGVTSFTLYKFNDDMSYTTEQIEVREQHGSHVVADITPQSLYIPTSGGGGGIPPEYEYDINGCELYTSYDNWNRIDNTNIVYNDYRYKYAPTQLTLSAINELLPGKIGYGKNGIVEGDGSIYNNLDLIGYINNFRVINTLYGEGDAGGKYIKTQECTTLEQFENSKIIEVSNEIIGDNKDVIGEYVCTVTPINNDDIRNHNGQFKLYDTNGELITEHDIKYYNFPVIKYKNKKVYICSATKVGEDNFNQKLSLYTYDMTADTWTDTVLVSENEGPYVAFYVDDKDNIYYGTTSYDYSGSIKIYKNNGVLFTFTPSISDRNLNILNADDTYVYIIYGRDGTQQIKISKFTFSGAETVLATATYFSAGMDPKYVSYTEMIDDVTTIHTSVVENGTITDISNLNLAAYSSFAGKDRFQVVNKNGTYYILDPYKGLYNAETKELYPLQNITVDYENRVYIAGDVLVTFSGDKLDVIRPDIVFADKGNVFLIPATGTNTRCIQAYIQCTDVSEVRSFIPGLPTKEIFYSGLYNEGEIIFPDGEDWSKHQAIFYAEVKPEGGDWQGYSWDEDTGEEITPGWLYSGESGTDIYYDEDTGEYKITYTYELEPDYYNESSQYRLVLKVLNDGGGYTINYIDLSLSIPDFVHCYIRIQNVPEGYSKEDVEVKTVADNTPIDFEFDYRFNKKYPYPWCILEFNSTENVKVHFKEYQAMPIDVEDYLSRGQHELNMSWYYEQPEEE